MHRYLFDNNIYRFLSTSKDGEALRRLNQSLGEFDLLKTISKGDKDYKLTPYTLIEALGVIVPAWNLEIPSNLKGKKTVPQLVNYVMQKSYQFYSMHPNLTKEHLLEMANAQSLHTDISTYSKKLEQSCIYNLIESPAFCHDITEYLCFDFVCKQDYPKELILPLLDYLFVTNHYDNPITSLSKYRLVKQQWKHINHLYKKDATIDLARLKSFETSMKLKTEGDGLDCDLIHLVCVGDYVNNDYSPVIAFTCDDRDIVTDRIVTYKSLNAMYVDIILSKEPPLKANLVFTKWKQGIVVFCNKDGTINDYLEVDKLPPF